MDVNLSIVLIIKKKKPSIFDYVDNILIGTNKGVFNGNRISKSKIR